MTTPRRDEGGLATLFETAEPATAPPPPPSRVARRAGTSRPKLGPFARVVGVLGELLITAGIILGLFVVWQVYWTDVEAGVTQRAALEELRDRGQGLPEEATAPGEGDPPIIDAPAPGEVFASLHVPRWGGENAIPVAEGVGMDLLNIGYAGHYEETQLPGEVGNFALAAHRQSYGAAFRHVDSLETGDRMVVWTEKAWLVYEVTDAYIVLPHEVDVLAPVPREPGVEATERTITLTTCHPLFQTAERYIVHGEMTEWYPPSQTMPEHLREVS
ncbi:class E sortase [Bogoriella caseilytica]|uniref:Sortase A n=1 Tax=Bogoriella caseilytica TaxID=56055 RepID=A0A3N2BDK8_9MICO|nr:class E sortase [Bogoriella caseilytica]ROR73329.1 sortase A [Bogoriella caseilytica]